LEVAVSYPVNGKRKRLDRGGQFPGPIGQEDVGDGNFAFVE
jgi:hypothetical protein